VGIGDVTGDATGDATGEVTGEMTGEMTGETTPDVAGAVTGDIAAEAAAFLREHHRRTHGHDPETIASLTSPDATYWFTDGSHRGRDAIVSAIADPRQTVEDETYEIRDIEVVAQTESLAVLRYTVHWTGRVDGHPAAGRGRGSNIVARRGSGWQILHEHLRP
jgi:hypothetical protein